MSIRFEGNIFYATDGSWGDSTNLVIFDTSDWSGEDETAFEELSDEERARYADIYAEFPHLRPTNYATFLEKNLE